MGRKREKAVERKKGREGSSGGSMLGPGGTGPQTLPRHPKFLIGSIVISLSRCCLPNDERPGPPNIFS